jgi:uncharacterized protein (DUF2336 family)
MNGRQTLIDELEDVIGNNEIGRRAEVLRRVTDLFVSGSAELSDDQVALFDEVMSRLVEEVDKSTRAVFGHRLATTVPAPPNVIRILAFDDAIEVAGPVLSQSEELDDSALIEGARTKSQDHLLAISRRRSLVEPVTDVLVDRGNGEVALSVATNPGARFSEFGYSELVRRSENDDRLAVGIWTRPEVPRQHLLRLFADASEAVRMKFESSDHRRASLVREMIALASNQMQSEARERSADYAAAQSHVQSLHRSGELCEAHLLAFARAGSFDETAIALSLSCDLPIAAVERALSEDRAEQSLVLAKAIGLSWDTAKAILLLTKGAKGGSSQEFERSLAAYTRLHQDTAKKALDFYRLRERAARPRSN